MFRFFFLLLLFPIFLMAQPADCTAYFSPKDQLAMKLIDLIDEEEKNIKVAIYCMTHLGIAKALIRAQERGVAIEVLVDPFSVKVRSSIHRLAKAKIPLYVWDKAIRMGGQSAGKSLMHDKFCIFGDHLVWTGSFNFTNRANKNHQENAVVIESKEIAQSYLEQFHHMKLYESRPLQEYQALHPKKKRRKVVQ